MKTTLQQSYSRSEVAQLRSKWISEWNSETMSNIKSLLIKNIKDILNHTKGIDIDPDYIMIGENINDFLNSITDDENNIKDLAKNHSCRELAQMFRESEYCNA